MSIRKLKTVKKLPLNFWHLAEMILQLVWLTFMSVYHLDFIGIINTKVWLDVCDSIMSERLNGFWCLIQRSQESVTWNNFRHSSERSHVRQLVFCKYGNWPSDTNIALLFDIKVKSICNYIDILRNPNKKPIWW